MKRLLYIIVFTLPLYAVGYCQFKDTVVSSGGAVSEKEHSPDIPLQVLTGSVLYSATFFLLGGNDILINKVAENESSSYRVAFAPLLASVLSSAVVTLVGEITSHRKANYYITVLATIGSFFVSNVTSKLFDNKSAIGEFAGFMIPSVAIPTIVFCLTHTNEPTIYTWGN